MNELPIDKKEPEGRITELIRQKIGVKQKSKYYLTLKRSGVVIERKEIEFDIDDVEEEDYFDGDLDILIRNRPTPYDSDYKLMMTKLGWKNDVQYSPIGIPIIDSITYLGDNFIITMEDEVGNHYTFNYAQYPDRWMRLYRGDYHLKYFHRAFGYFPDGYIYKYVSKSEEIPLWEDMEYFPLIANIIGYQESEVDLVENESATEIILSTITFNISVNWNSDPGNNDILPTVSPLISLIDKTTGHIFDVIDSSIEVLNGNYELVILHEGCDRHVEEITISGNTSISRTLETRLQPSIEYQYPTDFPIVEHRQWLDTDNGKHPSNAFTWGDKVYYSAYESGLWPYQDPNIDGYVKDDIYRESSLTINEDPLFVR